MVISNEILKIVAEKEENNLNFDRCLNVLVCPKCGNSLNSKCGDNFTDYKCTLCGFKYYG